MKCLTVRQPFAALIVAGLKTIECRGWQPRFRGPLLIHAGLGTLPLDSESRLSPSRRLQIAF